MAAEKKEKVIKNDFIIYEVVLSEYQDTEKYFRVPLSVALKEAHSIFASFFEGKKLNLYLEHPSKDGDDERGARLQRGSGRN